MWLGPVWSHPHSGNSISPCRSAVRAGATRPFLSQPTEVRGKGWKRSGAGPPTCQGFPPKAELWQSVSEALIKDL